MSKETEELAKSIEKRYGDRPEVMHNFAKIFDAFNKTKNETVGTS